jgi:hypothetical protein
MKFPSRNKVQRENLNPWYLISKAPVHGGGEVLISRQMLGEPHFESGEGVRKNLC